MVLVGNVSKLTRSPLFSIKYCSIYLQGNQDFQIEKIKVLSSRQISSDLWLLFLKGTDSTELTMETSLGLEFKFIWMLSDRFWGTAQRKVVSI